MKSIKVQGQDFKAIRNNLEYVSHYSTRLGHICVQMKDKYSNQRYHKWLNEEERNRFSRSSIYKRGPHYLDEGKYIYRGLIFYIDKNASDVTKRIEIKKAINRIDDYIETSLLFEREEKKMRILFKSGRNFRELKLGVQHRETRKIYKIDDILWSSKMIVAVDENYDTRTFDFNEVYFIDLKDNN